MRFPAKRGFQKNDHTHLRGYFTSTFVGLHNAANTKKQNKTKQKTHTQLIVIQKNIYSLKRKKSHTRYKQIFKIKCNQPRKKIKRNKQNQNVIKEKGRGD